MNDSFVQRNIPTCNHQQLRQRTFSHMSNMKRGSKSMHTQHDPHLVRKIMYKYAQSKKLEGNTLKY